MAKKFFSRKYSKIITMDAIVKAKNESSDTAKDKLIIHTSNGIYMGDLRNYVDITNTEIEENDDTLTCFNKMYVSSLEKYLSSEKNKEIPEISENPITIELENVRFISGNININMPFIEIFVDQIVGFSMGSFEN